MAIEVFVEGWCVVITNKITVCSEVIRDLHHGLRYTVVRESGQILAEGTSDGNDPEYRVIH